MTQKESRFAIYKDEELMRFVCAGEVGAFDELHHRYARQLMGYFIRMLNYESALAEDAVQDMFLKIAEEPQKFDQTRSFKTWLFSVASNYCKNFYRHKQIVNNHVNEFASEKSSIDEEAFLSLASKIDALKFREILEETLKTLPAEKMEAFILKYQEDKSIAEIALIQECPEGSVKSRIHYTLKILEEKLKMFNPVIH